MGQQQWRAAAVDLVIDVDPVPIDLWHHDFLAASRRIWLRPYSSAILATRGNAHAGKLTSRLPSGVGGRIQRQLYDKIIAATHNVDFANLFSSAQAAKAVGKPVKVIYSRENDMTMDYSRPLTFQKIKAGLDGDGRLIAINHDLCRL